MINAIIVLKVWDDDVEVIDFVFPKIDARMKELEEKLAAVQSEDEAAKKQIIGELCELDGLQEMGSIDLGQHGDISEEIYKEYALPAKANGENECEFMCFEVDITYTESRGYFGDVDTDWDIDVKRVDLKDTITKYTFDISDEDLKLIK